MPTSLNIQQGTRTTVPTTQPSYSGYAATAPSTGFGTANRLGSISIPDLYQGVPTVTGTRATGGTSNMVQNPAAAPTAAPAAQPAAPSMGSTTGEFGGPGAAESAYAANSGKFFGSNPLQDWWTQNSSTFGQPGQGEQYWNQVSGRLMAPTNSEQTFKNFQAPTLAQTPNLQSYYDVAQKRAADVINRGLAARGMYGSTAGLQQLGRSATDLAAEEANRNAQYEIERQQEQRAWEQLHGGLASAADMAGTQRMGLGGSISQGAEGQALQRLGMGGNAAAATANTGLNYLNSGMGAAEGAQGLQMQRGQNLFNNTYLPSRDIGQMMMGGYGGAMGSDQAIFDAIQSLGLGEAGNGVNTANGNQAQTMGQIGNLINLFAMAGRFGSGAAGGSPGGSLPQQPFMSPTTSASGY